MITIIASRIPGIGSEADAPEEVDARTEDEKLLNGPQMADKAISQEDIDNLLSDF